MSGDSTKKKPAKPTQVEKPVAPQIRIIKENEDKQPKKTLNKKQ